MKSIRTWSCIRSWLRVNDHLRKVYDHLLRTYDLSFENILWWEFDFSKRKIETIQSSGRKVNDRWDVPRCIFILLIRNKSLPNLILTITVPQIFVTLRVGWIPGLGIGITFFQPKPNIAHYSNIIVLTGWRTCWYSVWYQIESSN